MLFKVDPWSVRAGLSRHHSHNIVMSVEEGRAVGRGQERLNMSEVRGSNERDYR